MKFIVNRETSKSKNRGLTIMGKTCRILQNGELDCYVEFDDPKIGSMWVDTEALTPVKEETKMKKWVVYFKGPENLQDKILGQISERRMREILAGPGLSYSQDEIERIIAQGEFKALYNVDFVQHPAGVSA